MSDNESDDFEEKPAISDNGSPAPASPSEEAGDASNSGEVVEDNDDENGEEEEEEYDAEPPQPATDSLSAEQNQQSFDSEPADSMPLKTPTKVELFGDESEEENGSAGKLGVGDLFGELSDDDDDEDKGEDEEGIKDEVDAASLAAEEPGEGAEEAEAPVIEERRIEVDIPYVSYDFGKEQYYIKLPNFLTIYPRPFDPDRYKDPDGAEGAEEVFDEEGRTRLKMAVENTIRWQYVMDSDGQRRPASNTRIVRWSDGSMSLHLGSEIFDIHVMSEQQGDYNHLFVKQGNGLVGQAVFKKKLIFRPHSTDSLTHKKMTLSMAHKVSSGIQQVKEITVPRLRNPELDKDSRLKREEETLRAAARRDSQVQRVRQSRLSTKSLEEGTDEPGTISLLSIKQRFAAPRRSIGGSSVTDSSESKDAPEAEDNGEEPDEAPAEKGSSSESNEEEMEASSSTSVESSPQPKKRSSTRQKSASNTSANKRRRLTVADADDDD